MKVTGAIRVMSANLWLGQADPDALLDLIREQRIDVFAAQELGQELAEVISSELPYGVLDPRDNDHFGMGIALRAPAKHSRIPMYLRDAHRVVMDPKDWPGLASPLDFVNVHLQAPHSLRPFPSVLVRHRQISALEDYFDANPSDARLIVGDFNSTPIWGVYRRLARRFSDGAVVCARRDKTRPQATWGPSADSRRVLRIDHAMSHGLGIERFQVVGIPGSDHSALIFDCFPEPSEV